MSVVKQIFDDSRPLTMLAVSLGLALAAFLCVMIDHTNLFLLAMAATLGI
jgi:hypothetical protein